MQTIQDFCPSNGKVLVQGDMLSMERMQQAQVARSNCASEAEQFSNVVPVPQEFHKEIIALQVCIKFMTIKQGS